MLAVNILFFTNISARIVRQTPGITEMEFESPTRITVPENVYVTGYISRDGNNYLIKECKLYKTLQPYIKAAYRAEIEYEIKVGDEIINDVQITGDFSTQMIGIVGCGIFIGVLLRLFG